jgi:hypothetical protein
MSDRFSQLVVIHHRHRDLCREGRVERGNRHILWLLKRSIFVSNEAFAARSATGDASETIRVKDGVGL